MEPDDHVHTAYVQIRRLIASEKWSAAADVARTLPDLSADELNGYPYHELWWQFAEDLAARFIRDDPKLARRLFELVEMSFIKEASMASAAGEAYAVQPHIDRVRARLSGLSAVGALDTR